MESTVNVGDSEDASSKATNGSSVDLPHIGVKMPENAPQRAKRCPECGSDCLDVHVDSKGEVFYFCLRSMDMFPASDLVA